jgi:preprotein translocase subunit SecY
MALVAFLAAMFLAFVLTGAINVFWLGQFERAYGASGTFSLIVVFGLAAGLLSTLSFGVSARLLRRRPTVARAIMLGVACAVVATLVVRFLAAFSASGVVALPWTAVVFFVCAALASFLSQHAYAHDVKRGESITGTG